MVTDFVHFVGHGGKLIGAYGVVVKASAIEIPPRTILQRFLEEISFKHIPRLPMSPAIIRQATEENQRIRVQVSDLGVEYP
jgi:hypothetical protein